MRNHRWIQSTASARHKTLLHILRTSLLEYTDGTMQVRTLCGYTIRATAQTTVGQPCERCLAADARRQQQETLTV